MLSLLPVQVAYLQDMPDRIIAVQTILHFHHLHAQTYILQDHYPQTRSKEVRTQGYKSHCGVNGWCRQKWVFLPQFI